MEIIIILKNINQIQNRLSNIVSLLDLLELHKLETYIKWSKNSCWLDSGLMGILAYPVKTVNDNILNINEINISNIAKNDKNRMHCTNDDIQKIHKDILQLHKNMHTQSNECLATSLWQNMNKCNLSINVGKTGTTSSIFQELSKIYPNVFVLPIINLIDSTTIADKFNKELGFNGLLYNKNIKGKLVGLLIENKTKNINIGLVENFTITTYTFKMISIVYHVSLGHIGSFIKNYENNWIKYNGLIHVFRELGKFADNYDEILKEMYSIEMTASFIVYEVL